VFGLGKYRTILYNSEENDYETKNEKKEVVVDVGVV
jgi:hypothetical protein